MNEHTLYNEWILSFWLVSMLNLFKFRWINGPVPSPVLDGGTKGDFKGKNSWH